MGACPFDSRNEYFKKPFGAVRRGESVAFKLRLSVFVPNPRVFLVVANDYGETHKHPCRQVKRDGDENVYGVSVTLEETGLYWYYFQVEQEDGHVFTIKKGPHHLGSYEADAPLYQLTCYGEDFETPAFLKGGLLYQILPDRFAKSGDKHPQPFGDRVLRSDWGGLPHWRPDEQGEVRNNDYFQGDLKGIEEKLPYLRELGVTAVYLNPIFEAHSNHRYNTADYMKIDPMLGEEADFVRLCETAKGFGISVILDGVFSHTGSDSIYFNKEGRYPSVGAYQSRESAYIDWYKFRSWPDDFAAWWGIRTLPETNEMNESYRQFICGPGGVVEHWLGCGAAGFRLDVADELPDEFIKALRNAVKSQGEEKLLLGEVWEDASTKISYGVRRSYFEGQELDSVMNYPFKNAILDFVRGGNADALNEVVYTVLEHYPPCVCHCLMNFLSTHDTERALTFIGGEPAERLSKEAQSGRTLTPTEYAFARDMLCIAFAILYFLPGVPCIYYGDEIGMQGYRDPFNRRCFPWGSGDDRILSLVKTLGKLRSSLHCLKAGRYQTVYSLGDLYAFLREDEVDGVLVAVNRGESYAQLDLPEAFARGRCALGQLRDGKLLLPPRKMAIVTIQK